MSLNQFIQDKYKPWLNVRTNDNKIDGNLQIAENNGSLDVDTDFGAIYPKSDGNLYFKNENQVEFLLNGGGIGSQFISEDSNAFPNQKRSGTQANNSVGLNSDLTTYSTTETGAANLGLVIGSEIADKLAQFVAIKHQDNNEEPAYVMIRTRGTEAAQTAVQADDKIGAIYGISYNDNNVYEVNGILQFEAVNNQTATNSDARFVVRLTETNNVTTSEAFIIDQDASIALRETTEPGSLLGFGKIYVKSSTGLPYFKDASGTEYPLTGAASAETLQQTYDVSLPNPEIVINTNDPLIIKNDVGDVSQEIFGVYDNAGTLSHLSVQKDRIIADGNIAIGLGTTNVFPQCISIGAGSSSNSIQSTSIGVGAQCGFGASGSISVGPLSNVQGAGSVGIGNMTVSGGDSVVIGRDSTDISGECVIIGKNNSVNNHSNNVAIGQGNTFIDAVRNQIYGDNNTVASLPFSDSLITCIGYNNSVSGVSSIVLGNDNQAGPENIFIGNNIRNISASTSVSFNPDTNIATTRLPKSFNVFNNERFNLNQGDDETKGIAENNGNVAILTDAGNITLADDLDLFNIDTQQDYRVVGFNNHYLLNIDLSIVNKDRNNGNTEIVRSTVLCTYQSDTTNLIANSTVNTTLITGDYAGTISTSIDGDRFIRFRLSADGINTYHVNASCKLIVNNTVEV